MEYKTRRRRERFIQLDDSVDPPVEVIKTRMRTLYEWDAPDGTRFRSPDPDALDRRRWTRVGRDEEDDDENRVPQPRLEGA